MPEWIASASPARLGAFLSKQASPRKSGLFLRHLCRCFPEVFRDARSWAALDAADRYEAGELDRDGFLAAIRAADEAAAREQAAYEAWVFDPGRASGTAELAAAGGAILAREVASRGYYPAVLTDLRRAVLDRAGQGAGPRRNRTARVMRPVFLEHFGDPSRPVTLDPAWLTSTVVATAEGIYAGRAFDRMPLLADVLMDAGCDDDAILNHCRGEGPHARGCFVLDRILSKE